MYCSRSFSQEILKAANVWGYFVTSRCVEWNVSF